MACNDERGREVLAACREAGLRVPEEVAVVGVDNDELLCELADPPLSSVALNAEAGGYRAAALLDRMMRGKSRNPERLLVEPLYVVARRSTDIVALDDPEVAAAVHFIQDHASEPIVVPDIVNEVMISRRALELRFRREIGRTLHAEIRRVRLERASRLLVETNMPITQVARASGFRRASYLAQEFCQAFGSTPARYRRTVLGEVSEDD
jgi:LacI family transcriptional regulator